MAPDHLSPWIVRHLFLIPALPGLAAALIAPARASRRRMAAALAIGALAISFLFSLLAFAAALGNPQPQVSNFNWLQLGGQWVALGWLLDPAAALMIVMVTFVGLLIFIYSAGYMAHDENFTRFFCFLSLFAAAMLGLVLANSLLLLFMCWELVGLASYLLIGFWYERPAAAAAAKKAFITTRIGDLGLLLGMVWLYAQSGTLLFYNGGAGCLEPNALAALAAHKLAAGIAASTAIALLLFLGAAGKSGQVPLHVWLPDAMEGPTPVSALIHAATMVAAGVFLIARVYPLMRLSAVPGMPGTALQVVAWVGAITAFFAAAIAVAQNDIKRILAYSTVSQLGYMMLGLGVGGVAVGFFHLITHAFFKSLLFLGAGSVIHGCDGEQDIRRMGGLKGPMPATFLTYAVGMLALCGFPLLFSGFWSKDEILFSAHRWSGSQAPFYLGAAGALLTAFYMTRQVCYVFFGSRAENSHHAHESPPLMTVPLIALAPPALLLGFLGTPAWPWFQEFLEGRQAAFHPGALLADGRPALMLSSSLIVLCGLGLGWRLYGRRDSRGRESSAPGHLHRPDPPDPLERMQPALFHALQRRLFVDEFYDATILALFRQASRLCGWLERSVGYGSVQLAAWSAIVLGQVEAALDTFVVNRAFDEGCHGIRGSARLLARFQNGRVQRYLTVLGVALVVFAALLAWGMRG